MQNRSYWSYLIRSKGRHGLHSPFVFDLVDKGFTAKIGSDFQKERRKWLRQLAGTKDEFKITDLGAGSGKLTTLRSVSRLARVSSSRGIYGDVLYRIAKHFQPGLILELGTSIGIGSVHLKKGAPGAQLITIEGCPETMRRAYSSFDHWELSGIMGINASFEDFLNVPSSLVYDLVFIDGHHNGRATLKYLEKLQKLTHSETLFIFDDIRWSDDMWEAWNTIVSDPGFHVTIDLGRMGLAWKRPQQTKEHFVLRPVILKTPFV